MTARLPLAKPMKLELNVDCYSGYVAVDVIPDEIGKEFDPIPGYDAGASRAAHMDSTCHRVRWGQRDVVTPNEAPSCFLRVKMKQASLFSFRWSEAG